MNTSSATSPRRAYRLGARAESMQATRDRILDAVDDAMRTRWYDELTFADLARAAGVSVITVRNFEAGKVARGRFAPKLMKQALEGAGVRFSAGEDGPVRLDNRTR